MAFEVNYHAPAVGVKILASSVVNPSDAWLYIGAEDNEHGLDSNLYLRGEALEAVAYHALLALLGNAVQLDKLDQWVSVGRQLGKRLGLALVPQSACNRCDKLVDALAKISDTAEEALVQP